MTSNYQKDPAEEQFLARLNAILAPHEKAGYQDFPETFPSLFILGIPRAGTTLLNQLIGTCLDVGYINNLIAAFWQAPVFGIQLSKKVLPAPTRSCFQSDFGRTSGLHEPHEFGYFWASLLGENVLTEPNLATRQTIDWHRIQQVLNNMVHAFGRPACFKSLALGWYATEFAKHFEKAGFIYIQRDPVQNALSLLRYREQFLGSKEQWVSLKPNQYNMLQSDPYWHQVAGQVYFLDQTFKSQLRNIPADRVLWLTYETLCKEPATVLDQVQNFMSRLGHPVASIFDPPASFVRSEYKAGTHPDYEHVRAAVSHFYEM